MIKNKYFADKILGVFSVARLSNKWQRILHQKTSKISIVKSVTLYALKGVIIIDIY